MYSFSFKVEIFDADFDDKTPHDECGILFADNFTCAMEKIEDWFGRTLCNVKYIHCLDDASLLILNERIVDAVEHRDDI